MQQTSVCLVLCRCNFTIRADGRFQKRSFELTIASWIAINFKMERIAKRALTVSQACPGNAEMCPGFPPPQAALVGDKGFG